MICERTSLAKGARPAEALHDCVFYNVQQDAARAGQPCETGGAGMQLKFID
jgi:hypothetical protein